MLPNPNDEVEAILSNLVLPNGALLQYFAGFGHIDPYGPQEMFIQSLKNWHNNRPPIKLLNACKKYIIWAIGSTIKQINTSKTTFKDSGGLIGHSGDKYIVLFNNSKWLLPNWFKSSFDEKIIKYNKIGNGKDSLAQRDFNFQKLAVIGSVFNWWKPSSLNYIVPRWWLFAPEMGFTTPLDEISGAVLKNIHDNWYDSTDSLNASLISCIACWAKFIDDEEFIDFINKFYNVINALMAASIKFTDSETGLIAASVYTKACYTLDNLEVTRALIDYNYLCTRVIDIDNEFSDVMDEEALGIYENRSRFEFVRRAQESASLKYLVNNSTDPGMYYPGWNGEVHKVAINYSQSEPEFYDAVSVANANELPWDIDDYTEDLGLREYFANWRKYIGKDSKNNDFSSLDFIRRPQPPSLWRYIVCAKYANYDFAPMNIDEMVRFINDIKNEKILNSKRNFKEWWSYESGSFIRIINILKSKIDQ